MSNLSEWIQNKKVTPPHNRSTWVQALALIKNNNTGEIRKYEDDMLWVDGSGPNTWIWEEGNYSCDCNRSLFFYRAGGEDEPEGIQCSDGKYSVNLYNVKNNECIFEEFDYDGDLITKETNGPHTM